MRISCRSGFMTYTFMPVLWSLARGTTQDTRYELKMTKNNQIQKFNYPGNILIDDGNATQKCEWERQIRILK